METLTISEIVWWLVLAIGFTLVARVLAGMDHTVDDDPD